MTKKQLSVAVVGVVLLIGSARGVAADDAAWEVLARAREGLAEAPLEARFVQTYVPAGFSTGDRESGRLYLALPGCLRWDYEDPYPRSYLLCARTVWVWSPDDSVGDRYLSVSREEAGLDFLLLSVERLRERYAATLDETTEGEVRIALAVLDAERPSGERPAGEQPGGRGPAGRQRASDPVPGDPVAGGAVPGDPLEDDPSAGGEAAFTEAEIVLDEASDRPVRLAYTDREGNRTAFELSDYRPLDGTRPFEPPTDIQWIDAE